MPSDPPPEKCKATLLYVRCKADLQVSSACTRCSVALPYASVRITYPYPLGYVSTWPHLTFPCLVRLACLPARLPARLRACLVACLPARLPACAPAW